MKLLGDCLNYLVIIPRVNINCKLSLRSCLCLWRGWESFAIKFKGTLDEG